MELLIVTLAHIRPTYELDAQTQVRQVTEALRPTPGLLGVRSYTSRDRRHHLLLTTWENEEVWQKVRDRCSPARLLQEMAGVQLMDTPEQWAMRYIWGYVRPAVSPTLAVALLARVHPEQAETIEQHWLESLHRQAAELLMTSAFLARGEEENGTPASGGKENARREPAYRWGTVFLNFLTWASEIEQEEFYTQPGYQNFSLQLHQAALIQMLALEQP
jgi:quinol monooxygenase YgiN